MQYDSDGVLCAHDAAYSGRRTGNIDQKRLTAGKLSLSHYSTHQRAVVLHQSLSAHHPAKVGHGPGPLCVSLLLSPPPTVTPTFIHSHLPKHPSHHLVISSSRHLVTPPFFHSSIPPLFLHHLLPPLKYTAAQQLQWATLSTFVLFPLSIFLLLPLRVPLRYLLKMVLFVDLDDENADPPAITTPHWQRFSERGLRTANTGALEEGRANPNKNTITEALGCYPYVKPLPPLYLGDCS